MSWFVIYTAFEWIARIVMVPVILRRRLPPVTALAWLSIIFFLPIVGVPAYLLLGVSYLGKRRRVAHRRYYRGTARSRRFEQRLADLHSHRLRPALEPEQRSMIDQAEQVSGNPILGGNQMRLLPTMPGFIRALVGDIDAAQTQVHLLYYIYWPDEIGRQVSDAMIRAAGRGVKCRLLADASGSRWLFRSAAAQQMLDAGVQVYQALPVAPWRRKLARMDLRNHRKVAVIDGRIGYTGSHNIAIEDYGNVRAGKWVDLSGRFTGPIVAQLQVVFLDDWAFDTGEHLEGPAMFPPLEPTGSVAAQVVPTGPNHEAETFRRVLIAALNVANRKIMITTPYLIPDEPTTLALCMAADRGVEVTILVPRRGDHPVVAAAARWHYLRLMESGVRIHHYCDGMLHAKTMTVDDSFAMLGSANMDVRSFELNFEVGALLYGRDVTRTLREAQQVYMDKCERIDLDQWRRRPPLRKYADAAAALLSPLL